MVAIITLPLTFGDLIDSEEKLIGRIPMITIQFGHQAFYFQGIDPDKFGGIKEIQHVEGQKHTLLGTLHQADIPSKLKEPLRAIMASEGWNFDIWPNPQVILIEDAELWVHTSSPMIINQPFGIGDILFLEPMFRHFWNKNKERPIVPVRDHLIWLQDYVESADFRKLSEFSWEDYGTDKMGESTEVNDEYFPARFANQVYRKMNQWDHSDLENMMADKYRLAGLDPEMWTTLKLKFPFEKVVSHPYCGGSYITVNNLCGVGEIDIPKMLGSSAHPNVVVMHDQAGTVIDWWQMILHAQENHHVSTCTFFIMQAIFNEFNHCGKAFIYPRPNEDGLRGVINLKPTYNCKLML